MKSSFSSFQLVPGIYKKLKPSDAYLVIILIILLSAHLAFVLHELNKFLTVETIVRYGTINEGIVGVPIHKNPLYAKNTAEKDIITLVHAGLLRTDNKGGFVPHLAENWEKKNNEYTFHVKDNAFFHDGFPVTTEDIAYTIGMIQESKEGGAHYEKWKGVSIEVKDKPTITIKIPEGNLNFPEEFSVPILPKHVWKKIPQKQRKNYKGSGVHVGAGPYKYEREAFILDDRPTKLVLTEFPGYVLGRPYIKKMIFHFFKNSRELLEAYNTGKIDAMHSIAAAEIPSLLKQNEDAVLYSAQTNRVFGIFFNTEDGRILQDPFLRSILSQQIMRDRIITKVFSGHATPLQAPTASDTEIKGKNIAIQDLEQTLNDVGWKFKGSTGQREKDGVPLRISFVFPNVEETRQVAEIFTERLERLGIKVEARTLPQEVLKNIIHERQFDIILYGYKAEKPKNLVAVWKPGDKENMATITGFNNEKLNELFSEMEKNTPPERLRDKMFGKINDNWKDIVYNEIKVEMIRNVPAIFLYSPHFLYILPKDIAGVSLEETKLGRITKPGDRFTNIHKWHTKKERVWSIISKNQANTKTLLPWQQ